MSRSKSGAPEPDVNAGAAGAEYVCLVAIDHRADKRIYPAGSVIRLDHLAEAQVQMLISRGYVRPV